MKRTMLFVTLFVLTAILTVGPGGSAVAGLCEKCRDKAYILSIGECTSCGGHTSSGAFKLCKKCSAAQGKCQHCLAQLGGGEKRPDDKRPGDKRPGRPKPIDLKKSATYTFGNWKYRFDISAPGTRSEGKWGRLSYQNRRLPIPEVNEHYRTPWGPIYWVGVPKRPWGDHGWMPFRSRLDRRKGKLLTKPGAQPKPQQIELTAADHRKTVTAAVGKSIVISLKGNITTGYSWRTAKLTGKAVEQVGEPKYVPRPHRPGIVGTGGTFVFQFKAVKPGRATVKLEYVRPWEKDKPPETTFSVTVEVPAD